MPTMFEVEWTSDVPLDECGDPILDAAVEHRKYFKTKEDAWAFARRVYPVDFFGAVRVTECEQESDPYTGPYLQYSCYSDYYEGEE